MLSTASLGILIYINNETNSEKNHFALQKKYRKLNFNFAAQIQTYSLYKHLSIFGKKKC